MREIPTCGCCRKENDNNMNKQKPHSMHHKIFKKNISMHHKMGKIAEEANYLHSFCGTQVTGHN